MLYPNKDVFLSLLMKDKKVLLKTYEYVPSNAIRCLDDFTKRVKFGEKGEVAMPPTQSLLAFP